MRPTAVSYTHLDVYKRQTARVSTVDLHGLRAYFTLGHNRARYFPPEDGGLLTPNPPGVFRIDHDQALQTTLNLRYQRHKNAEWVSFIWRYDSGMVVSGVPDAAAAMALTPNQQVTIGLACNGTYATVKNPVAACGGTVTSKLLTLPQTGMENDDHNPCLLYTSGCGRRQWILSPVGRPCAGFLRD